MTSILKFGTGSTVQLDVPSEQLVADCRQSSDPPLEDPAAAIAAALLEPLGYPPLAQSVVPGDVVAVVLDSDLPQMPALLAGAVHALLDAGTEAENIIVVQAPGSNRQIPPDLHGALPSEVAEAVNWVQHDPTDADQHAYLAADEEGEGVYVNRALCEADLVLPISCLRHANALDYHGMQSGWFPWCSNTETIKRFEKNAKDPAALKKQADHVGWLLGAYLAVQVVPAGNNQVSHVIAGEMETLAAESQRRWASAWEFPLDYRASLVVASIEGDQRDQTWQNVARALKAAGRAVLVDGAIAICTDLELGPPAALRYLAEERDLETALARIEADPSPDAHIALEVARALGRGPVYLLSRLDESSLEDLGFAPVSDGKQVARLASRFDSCILLGNAQYAWPTAEDVNEDLETDDIDDMSEDDDPEGDPEY